MQYSDVRKAVSVVWCIFCFVEFHLVVIHPVVFDKNVFSKIKNEIRIKISIKFDYKLNYAFDNNYKKTINENPFNYQNNKKLLEKLPTNKRSKK